MKNNKVLYAWYADNLPFYIGIGTVKRSQSIKSRNKYCLNKRAKAERKNCFEIRILHENLSWEQACELEQSYISLYGRKDLETGILTNMTNGGEGAQGHSIESRKKMAVNKGKVFSCETREKMSQSKKGTTHSQEARNKISKYNQGKSVNHSTRLKISNKLKGTTLSEETKQKIGKNSPKAMSIMTPKGEFSSCRSAAKALNLKHWNVLSFARDSTNEDYYFVK